MLKINKAPSSYLGRHLAIVHPAEGSEVCGLSTVEAVVKASMVSIRKCYHELAFVLSHLLRENTTYILIKEVKYACLAIYVKGAHYKWF